MKKQFIFIFILVLMSLASIAQDKPDWIYNKPTPRVNNTTISYVVAHGKGLNYEEAKKAALQDLNRQIHALVGEGIEVNTINGETYYKTMDGQQTKIQKKQIREWFDKVSSEMWYLYQVQNNATIDPVFEKFDDSNFKWFQAFVPGMGQFSKGQTTKGVCFLASEVVCIGGAVVAQSMRRSYINKMNNTNNASQIKFYADRANTYRTVRNIGVGAAAAVYVWNVLDAFVSKSNHNRLSAYGNNVQLTPLVSDEYAALSLSINF